MSLLSLPRAPCRLGGARTPTPPGPPASETSSRPTRATVSMDLAPSVLGDDVRDAQRVVLVDHDHLAAGDQPAVDQQVVRLAGGPVEFDNRAVAQGQQVVDGHPRAAELGAR